MNDLIPLGLPPERGSSNSGTNGLPIPGAKPLTKIRSDHVQDLKVADFVRVYLLGDGPQGRVIEEHAGQTGYHIRTIPSARFSNPVALAAGAGFLAVVDRFGAGDVIRVTDRYAGAGTGGFDSDGFPKDSINWGGIADIVQIPTLGRITGLQILPRGILVGALDMGNGTPTFVKWDIQNGFSLYTGIFTLPAPFDQLGNAAGRISVIDQTQTKWAHEILAIVRNDAAGNCLLKIDFLREKVTGLLGLPDGVPYGVSNAGGFVSVQIGDAHGISTVYRMERLDDSGFMSGVYSDLFVPAPDSATGLTNTFTPLDIAGANAVNYYYLAQTLNNRFGDAQSPGEEIVADPAVSQGGRAITGTTGSRNDGRISIATAYTTRFYGPPYQVPCQQITNPVGIGYPTISDSDVVNSSIVEMLTDGSGDTSKPLFRLLHGTHYDYLSDGGFVYGCSTPGQDQVTPVTGGMRPVSIAVDKASEPGKLKELPDLKIALIDTKTGLLLYTGTKSLGFKWYGGSSAGLKLTSDTQLTTKKTQCSTTQDAAIDATLDGVDYEYGADGSPTTITRDAARLAQFNTALDGRRPWALFIPRVINSSKLSVQPVDNRLVVTTDDTGAFLEWWLPAGARVSPAVLINSQNQIFYPPKGPNTPAPNFQTSCSSGFFGLNWAKQQNTVVDQNGTTVTFTTPPATLNYKLPGLSTTPAEEAADPEIVASLPALVGQPLFSVEAGLGDSPVLNRGVMFDTDIRSWIGVEVRLDRDGFLTDGVAGWTQPSAYENGLGVRVGQSAAGSAGHVSTLDCGGPRGSGIQPAYGYDYGDTAFNGAGGQWQVEIFANGRPIGSIGHLVTFPEQIEFLAPSEAQGDLMSTFHASGSVGLLGYHKGKVYYSKELITEVTIRAKLINYAYSVFRVGFHTLSYAHDDFIGSGPTLCSGADPGFYAANNCEASCCGNVSCLSQVLFGNKLYSSDPTRARVVNTLWEGQATFTIPPANNPYATQGVAVGNLINAYFQFLLNTTMSAYNINLRTGDGN